VSVSANRKEMNGHELQNLRTFLCLFCKHRMDEYEAYKKMNFAVSSSVCEISRFLQTRFLKVENICVQFLSNFSYYASL
jgi:hypothetical protein